MRQRRHSISCISLIYQDLCFKMHLAARQNLTVYLISRRVVPHKTHSFHPSRLLQSDLQQHTNIFERTMIEAHHWPIEVFNTRLQPMISANSLCKFFLFTTLHYLYDHLE